MFQRIFIILFSGLLSSNYLLAQNVAINTTGTIASALNMLEVTQINNTNNSVGIFSSNTGTGTNAYAIWAEATGAVNPYAIVVPANGGNVGIGTTTPIAKLEVIANSTNTNSTFLGLHFGGTQSVANSANYTGLVIDPVYSAAGTLTSMVALGVNNQNASTGTITTMHGIVSVPHNAAAGSIVNMFGSYSQPLNLAGGNITAMTGYGAIPRNSGAGTVSNMHGLYSNPGNTGAGTVTTMIGAHILPQKTGTGPVTNMYGLLVRLDNTNATGAVTIGYGIHIDDPVTTGAITNKYALVTGANAGNVGIGTITPQTSLQVFHSSTNTNTAVLGFSDIPVSMRNSSATNNNVSLFSFQDAGSFGTVVLGAVQTDHTSHSGEFMLMTTNAGVRGERVRVDKAGNVGIGITVPSTKLHVVGNIGIGLLPNSVNLATYAGANDVATINFYAARDFPTANKFSELSILLPRPLTPVPSYVFSMYVMMQVAHR